ncbi:MAG: DUF4301 family protein [Dysgonamonadaceae bacterium]|nr:DUF4301 family protein [Dysgonamonadaceae bacterium]MDD4727883.1 DUF4301 family protein [Dysgonamonadaceae bacterium]
MTYSFSIEDKNQLNEKGISEHKIDEQLNYFKNGFPTLNIKKPASINEGILQVDESDQLKYISIWEKYLKSDKHITKFVPASGAASRMFKDLFSFLESSSDEPTTDFEKKFFKNIRSFAFYHALNETCVIAHGMSIDDLITHKKFKKIVHSLLSEEGLNYGELPKGLLLFHSYNDKKRTPMEEHLVEGTMYAKDDKNNVNVHFTISPHHEKLFIALLDEIRVELEKTLNASFNVTFSIQKPSTDTIAVDLENKPFRDEGVLLFRPGGHGALIENLNDLHSDIVFVKNIDNIVPDRYKENDAKYKKMLGGILIETQSKAFGYLKKLQSGEYTTENLNEIKKFIENTLYITISSSKDFDNNKLVQYMIKKLNRPIRVCGMVRNEGEPGGGPFIVENKDGSYSPHILEGSQIVTDEAKELASKSTHFNPVDLVCGIKDNKGEKFNLLNYIDKETGFISSKSQSGRALKALELPGLWNGAMSDWNTIFVEVPISTFNPVKTVNDLLRDEHQ